MLALTIQVEPPALDQAIDIPRGGSKIAISGAAWNPALRLELHGRRV
jgi:hypothetical protein